jgi:putative membrane protein
MPGRRALVAGCLLLTAAGGAQAAATGPALVRHTSFFDSGFLQDAESSDLAQIGADVEAARHAGDPRVRDLAQRLAADHDRIDDDLRTIARDKAVSLRGALGAAGQRALDDLGREPGGRFDDAYLQFEIQQGQKALSLYLRAAESKDDEVRAFARRTLPVLQNHLRMAQALA